MVRCIAWLDGWRDPEYASSLIIEERFGGQQLFLELGVRLRWLKSLGSELTVNNVTRIHIAVVEEASRDFPNEPMHLASTVSSAPASANLTDEHRKWNGQVYEPRTNGTSHFALLRHHVRLYHLTRRR